MAKEKQIKKSMHCFIVLCLLFLVPINCFGAVFSHEKIAAVHYTSGHWAPSFWSNFDTDNLTRDFTRLKDNKINTIVVIIPWSGFQYSIAPVIFKEEYFQHLETLMHMAGEHGLNVIFRFGYAHEIGEVPSTPDHMERIISINTDGNTWDAWGSYVEKLYKISQEHDNFLFGFITWEDFFLLDLMRIPLSLRLKIAGRLKFDEFLKKYSIEEISRYYNQEFTDHAQVPIPSRDSKAVALFYEFWDEYLLSIFSRTKQLFPGLSMEVRVDCDPSNDDRKYICHDKTFDLNGEGDITTIYYTPAWGAPNNGDIASADTAIARLKYLIDTIKTKTDNQIFIDQFNFIDNTIGFEKNTKIASDELTKFIDKSAPLISKGTIGYALWALDDLNANLLANSSFERDLKGWCVIKGEHVKKKTAENEFEVLLHRSGSINQSFHLKGAGPPPDNNSICVTVQFTAKPEQGAAENGAVSITIKDKNDAVLKTEHITMSSLKSQLISCSDLPAVRQGTLQIENMGEDICIDDVEMFFSVQKNGIYTTDRRPKSFKDQVIHMNESIAPPQKAPMYYHGDQIKRSLFDGLFNDGWVGRHLSGEMAVPEQKKGKIQFAVEIYVPEAWRSYHNAVTLSIDGIKLSKKNIVRGYQKLIFDLPDTLAFGHRTSFLITSDKAYVPSFFDKGTTDVRELSFLLTGIGFIDQN